ncbi:hypothetical protein LOTGIDRAFT_122247 [Lottia gigantea]|uniref:Cytochrome c domain-containing protein n=1 Tax=Lottia gigantea TaxID=225164 RepID=V4A2S0_LOTGI|nr:hypothetical protein LOTGIDRAFT_122247 [Lottia gigantea]ESO90987.1 hypothetical protein LOTGIDRAFT_122247 [Lottia gigantea]
MLTFPLFFLALLIIFQALLAGGTLLATGGIGAAVILDQRVLAGELELHPPKMPWSHTGLFDSFDAASVRRGYFVYKQVCAACHSLNYLAYRTMVGAIFTEEEAKREAEEAVIVDGPDDEGHMFTRPGKLSDIFPAPYKNDEEARAANAGALPPDLSYIVVGRHGEEDYIFSLLTGYVDPPAGVNIPEGLHYNPYFPGGAIGMAQALYNEIIEYEDGTPATQSQLAKDVTIFLRWAAEPNHDLRKKIAIKTFLVLGFLTLSVYYFKKYKWSVVKSVKTTIGGKKL